MKAEQREEQFGIRDIIFAFKKNKKTFVLSFIAFSFFVAFSQFIFLKKEKKITYYEAKGSVGFGNFSYLPAIMRKLGINMNEISPDLEFESKVMVSDEVLGRAFDILQKGNHTQDYDESKKRFIGSVRGNLSVSIDQKEKLITITLVWEKKDEAVQIVNAILDAYYEYSQERFKNEVSRAIEMVDVALSHIEELLSRSYLDFASFAAKTGIVDAKYQIKLIFDSLQGLKDKLRNIDVKIAVFKNTLSDIDLKKKISAEDIFALSEIEGVEKLYEEYNSLQMKRDELLTQYTEKHPKVLSIDNQLNSIVERMKRIISFEIRKLQLERDAVIKEIAQINESIFNFSSQFVEYLRKRDKIDLINSLFYNYYEGLMNATLLGGIKFSMISKVSKPEFAVARSSRGNKLSWIIFLSFIVGLVAGFVSVYVSEVLDMKFRSVDEVEELISAPILGILPRFHDELSRLAFEQGIEGIRINVELLSLKKNIAIFCLSSISSEGKSTISFGLGKSFAAAGKKVVVLDLNLRHPALSNSLGYESSHGFVDIVTYDLKLEDVLKKIDENFYFIPAGTRHPSPSSFLSHQKIKDFIISLKEKFDYIIVDSSPILAVYDILNLIHLSDFNILIMGTDKISKVHAKRVSTLIRQVRSKIDGVVLNFVDEKVSPYIKYYVYKYGYYYYCYQSGDKTKRDNKKRK